MIKKTAAGSVEKKRIHALKKQVRKLEHRLRIMEQYAPASVEKWARLRKGMNTKQVIRLLGGPIKIVRTHTIFVYPRGGLASFDADGKLLRWQSPRNRTVVAAHPAWVGWLRPLQYEACPEQAGALISPRDHLPRGWDASPCPQATAYGDRHADPYGCMRPNQGWGSRYR